MATTITLPTDVTAVTYQGTSLTKVMYNTTQVFPDYANAATRRQNICNINYPCDIYVNDEKEGFVMVDSTVNYDINTTLNIGTRITAKSYWDDNYTVYTFIAYTNAKYQFTDGSTEQTQTHTYDEMVNKEPFYFYTKYIG